MKIKKYAFRHYQLPVTILYGDPEESLPKAIELLLKDIKENGLDGWNVKEITEEWGLREQPKPADLTPKEEEFEV